MTDLETVALFQCFPQLPRAVPWLPLGNWPTPVECLTIQDGTTPSRQLWVKREDRSSNLYGGNKVRTIEAHCGRALAEGRERIWSTGAFGSNHALATAMHAPTGGLETGALLFTQPVTKTAQANLSALATCGSEVRRLLTPVSLPWVIMSRWWRGDYVMTPGGATPVGALGHVSAALELAMQVEAGELPPPRGIFLAAGSTCTSAGLLVGLVLAQKLGIGFGPHKASLPTLCPVRVTPWPITSTMAMLLLARWTARRLNQMLPAAAQINPKQLAAHLQIIGGHIGRGYGHPTRSGTSAKATFAAAGGPPLDLVYSGKSAAGTLANMANFDGPVLFWATKSSAPLPVASDTQLLGLPPSMQRWLRKKPQSNGT